jgi:hypothetical protein
VLSLNRDYARLEVDQDQPFVDITESIRALIHVCRLNGLRSALVVSHQFGFDLRSSLRVALKFVSSRPAPLPQVRLAIVAPVAAESVLATLERVAEEIGLECKGFREEAQAMAWLTRVS